MYFEKFLKKSIKLLTSPFLVMLQTFLLEDHSKENCALKGHSRGTLRSLQEQSGTRAHEGHLGTQGTWALKTTGHLGTRALEALGHSRHLGTWVLGHSKGTRRALGHSGT